MDPSKKYRNKSCTDKMRTKLTETTLIKSNKYLQIRQSINTRCNTMYIFFDANCPEANL